MSNISPKERAANSFRVIEESLDTIYRALDEGRKTEEDDDPQVALDHYPMQVELERSVRVVLTAGGPHIEAVAAIDAAGKIDDVILKAYVGSQYFTKFVKTDTALHRAMAHYVESVIL